jgi:hypothetical protein
MRRSSKRKLLAGTAVVAALAGGTLAAVTAAGEGPRGHAAGARATGHARADSNIAVAAGYLGLSTAQLRSELQSGKTLAEIANASSGKSEAGLIQALVAARRARLAAASASLPQRVASEVHRGAGAGRPSTASRYLGLSAAQLRSEVRSGRTLAQIADATNGKSAAGLIDALVAARKQRLAAALSAGRLTQAQESALLAHLSSRMSARVNRVYVRG